jgi:Carboxypeptidase regulatory-like domain
MVPLLKSERARGPLELNATAPKVPYFLLYDGQGPVVTSFLNQNRSFPSSKKREPTPLSPKYKGVDAWTASGNPTNQGRPCRHPTKSVDERPRHPYTMDSCRKPVLRHKPFGTNPATHAHDLNRGASRRKPTWTLADLHCLSWISLFFLLFCSSSALAQPQQPFAAGIADSGLPDATGTVAYALNHLPQPQSAGTISGTVVDRTGTALPNAHVRLARENQSLSQETVANNDGQFSFVNVAPGPFQLIISSDGFATQTISGNLLSGETYTAPAIALFVAGTSTQVRVSMSPIEIAEAEIKDEEKQRVLGVLPNFYVTYNPTAVPLKPKQKFELAWKATIDPVNFGVTAGVAGIEQASNAFGGYGQGAKGYGERYGASYADLVTGTFIGAAILPSILKQDPRYFYKGSGTVRSRILYAIANSVICRGDNGHWQANYSAIAGSIAAGGISNLYYPTTDRGAGLVFENALIGIGSTAATNILQEFVIRKLTPHAPNYSPPSPNGK